MILIMSTDPDKSWQRIVIVGCSGGGKSTLARALAVRTGLPLYHLDQEYWLPGWRMPDRDDWNAKHAALLKRPRWIIEGTYASNLSERAALADVVVFLDLPRWRCLFRVLRRVVMSYGKVRPDMAPGCPEQFDASFIRYVWTFKRQKIPQIEAAINGYNVVRFSSQKAAYAWLETVAEKSANGSAKNRSGL
jgi:adenylate kinase family enzyme